MYTKKFRQESAHDDGIWCCAWGRFEKESSEVVVTGSVDDKVKIWTWSREKLDLKHTCEGHQLGVVSVDLNKTGSIAASSSLDAMIRIWDIETGKQIRVINEGPADAWTVSFAPDGKNIATGSYTGKVNIFNVESGKKESNLSIDTREKLTMSISYSPDGKYLACGSIDGFVFIYDFASCKSLTIEAHCMPIRSLAFSPNSQILVTGSDDCQIKLFDVKTGTSLGTLSGHGSWVLSVAFSPDNLHFVSSSSDKTVKIWDREKMKVVHSFYEHQDQVWSARYNPAATNIVSVSEDRSINVYECPTTL